MIEKKKKYVNKCNSAFQVHENFWGVITTEKNLRRMYKKLYKTIVLVGKLHSDLNEPVLGKNLNCSQKIVFHCLA